MRTCLTIAAALIAAGANAAEPAAEQRKVFIDPETGERRAPTAQELGANQGATQANRKLAPMPDAERTAEGVKIYRLEPAQRSALQAQRVDAEAPLHVEHGAHGEAEK